MAIKRRLDCVSVGLGSPWDGWMDRWLDGWMELQLSTKPRQLFTLNVAPWLQQFSSHYFTPFLTQTAKLSISIFLLQTPLNRSADNVSQRSGWLALEKKENVQVHAKLQQGNRREDLHLKGGQWDQELSYNDYRSGDPLIWSAFD